MPGYEFRISQEKAIKEYFCPICSKLIKKALILPCSDTACRDCLEDLENKHPGISNCPVCDNPYDKEKVREGHQGKFIDRIITNNVDIKCKQCEQGCNWIGTIANYDAHEKTCLYVQHTCRFMDKVRKDIAMHEQNCRICQTNVTTEMEETIDSLKYQLKQEMRHRETMEQQSQQFQGQFKQKQLQQKKGVVRSETFNPMRNESSAITKKEETHNKDTGIDITNDTSAGNDHVDDGYREEVLRELANKDERFFKQYEVDNKSTLEENTKKTFKENMEMKIEEGLHFKDQIANKIDETSQLPELVERFPELSNADKVTLKLSENGGGNPSLEFIKLVKILKGNECVKKLKNILKSHEEFSDAMKILDSYSDCEEIKNINDAHCLELSMCLTTFNKGIKDWKHVAYKFKLGEHIKSCESAIKKEGVYSPCKKLFEIIETKFPHFKVKELVHIYEDTSIAKYIREKILEYVMA